jgi:hypothetical protein
MRYQPIRGQLRTRPDLVAPGHVTDALNPVGMDRTAGNVRTWVRPVDINLSLVCRAGDIIVKSVWWGRETSVGRQGELGNSQDLQSLNIYSLSPGLIHLSVLPTVHATQL